MKIRCDNCIVKQVKYFSSSVESSMLERLVDNKSIERLKKGEVLFQEGDRLKGIYCIQQGFVKMFKLSDNGRYQIVKIVSKGELVGQRSVISNEPTNLSAVALEDMEVCFLPKAYVKESLFNNSYFANTLLKHMAFELKQADNIIINMAQKSVSCRMAEVLLYLESNFGIDKEGYIFLVLSRKDIASIVGTATELCIRTLAEFKRKKIISAQGKRIRLENKKKLYVISEKPLSLLK